MMMKIVISFWLLLSIFSCCKVDKLPIRTIPSYNELKILSHNCEYLNKQIKTNLKKSDLSPKMYIYQKKLVLLLSLTDCFELKSIDDIISLLGEPSEIDKTENEFRLHYIFTKDNQKKYFVSFLFVNNVFVSSSSLSIKGHR